MVKTLAIIDWITVPTAAGFFRWGLFWVPLALILSWGIRWLCTRPWALDSAENTADPDPYAAAYLSGGPGRVADAAIASMFRAGKIQLRKPKTLGVVADRPEETSGVLGAVWDIAAAAGTVDDARRAVRRVVLRAWVDSLVEQGLALTRRARMWLGLASALPMGLLMVAVVSRVIVGMRRDEDVVGVTWLGILVGVSLLWLLTNGPRSTAAGRRLLRRLKKDRRPTSAILGQTPEDWAWTCGLFGVMALSADEAAQLQAGLRPGNGGDGDTPDGGSGCSGCSGCGGCGGCGD